MSKETQSGIVRMRLKFILYAIIAGVVVLDTNLKSNTHTDSVKTRP